MAGEIDPFTAWLAGWGHEIDGMLHGQPFGEMRMDLHNNAVGRDAGEKDCPVNSGDLVTNPNNNKVPY